MSAENPSSTPPEEPGSAPAASLEQVISVLRRRWLVIALCAVVATGGAIAITAGQRESFTASASLLFSGSQLDEQVAGLSSGGGAVEAKTQQDTDVKLLELGPTRARTARQLGGGLTATSVGEAVSIVPAGESDLVEVQASGATAALAARLANVYARTFVKDTLTQSRGYYVNALRVIDRQLAALPSAQRGGPQGLDLRDRAQSLGILAQMRSGEVTLAEAARPPSGPSSPKRTRDAVLGMILGLLVGVALAFGAERLDRRIKDPEDLQRAYGLPLLGTVPESGALRRADGAGAGAGASLEPMPDREMESMRMLRAKLRYFNVDRELRVLIVASAGSGEGKSTVALGLAQAAASMGERVLLVEADLRRPSLAGWMGVKAAPGLSEALAGVCGAEQAIQVCRLPVHGPSPGNSSPGSPRQVLSVLTAGAPPPNPGGLLESEAMGRLLSWAADRYEMVLIDTPPLRMVPDAIPLLGSADGVMMVGRLGASRRDHAARLQGELAGLGARMLGLVANAIRPRGAGYGYSYGYGYGRGQGRGGDEPGGAGGTPVGAPAAHGA